jgi:hypothetical protein
MKRTLTLAASIAILGATANAHADAYDCFPGCAPVPAAVERPVDLCRIAVVREAERVNDKLKPVREVYDIATNPTGYAVKLVDRHVVHIPKWVGIAMDPKGAARGYLINYVRAEAKKQVGLGNDCHAAAEEVIDESAGLDMRV